MLSFDQTNLTTDSRGIKNIVKLRKILKLPLEFIIPLFIASKIPLSFSEISKSMCLMYFLIISKVPSVEPPSIIMNS